MEDQRRGGNVLADKDAESFSTTPTIPLQQQHSNAQCWCSLHPWLNPVLLNRREEHTHVPLCSASALEGDARPLARSTLGYFCLSFAMTFQNKSGKCEQDGT